MLRTRKFSQAISLNFGFETFSSTNHRNWNALNADGRDASTFASARSMGQFSLKYVLLISSDLVTPRRKADSELWKSGRLPPCRG